MLKKMNSFYQMLFIVVFLSFFNSLQASEGLGSITFSDKGKQTKEAFIGTPKNWNRVDDVEMPFSYKFIHENGEIEAYLAFSCYQFRPTKGTIFLTVDVMKKLYGENFLDLIKNTYFNNDYDDSVFFYFVIPKDDKLEYVTICSYLDNYKFNDCITTIVFVCKKLNMDVFTKYGESFMDNIKFVNY